MNNTFYNRGSPTNQNGTKTVLTHRGFVDLLTFSGAPDASSTFGGNPPIFYKVLVDLLTFSGPQSHPHINFHMGPQAGRGFLEPPPTAPRPRLAPLPSAGPRGAQVIAVRLTAGGACADSRRGATWRVRQATVPQPSLFFNRVFRV